MRTRGHTLFVVEVLRALASGQVGVPESLRTAVQARVRRAGAAVESLLRAAAVLGATVDPLTLGIMLDLVPATALELCEAALEARLLVVSGRDYEFANDLIREALYASTPEPTRLAHHRRAAELLTGQPESLARHAAAAGDWLRAARAWLRAGEDAMGRYAASDAAALASQALEAGERVADAEVCARALVLRGRAREAAGAHAAALDDLTRGAERARTAGDRRLEMLALRELGGDVPAALGKPIGYYAVNLQSGLRIAESLGDRASEAVMLNRLAVIEANRLRLDAAVGYGRRGVAAGRAAADDHALAAGLDGLKIAYLSLGDTSALADVLAELKPLLRRLGDLFLMPWAEFEGGFLAIAAADWEQADAAIADAIELNHQAGYPHQKAWYLAHQGWLGRLRGRTVPGLRRVDGADQRRKPPQAPGPGLRGRVGDHGRAQPGRHRRAADAGGVRHRRPHGGPAQAARLRVHAPVEHGLAAAAGLQPDQPAGVRGERAELRPVRGADGAALAGRDRRRVRGLPALLRRGPRRRDARPTPAETPELPLFALVVVALHAGRVRRGLRARHRPGLGRLRRRAGAGRAGARPPAATPLAVVRRGEPGLPAVRARPGHRRRGGRRQRARRRARAPAARRHRACPRCSASPRWPPYWPT